MHLTKFGVCSTLAGIGYFAASNASIGNPVKAAVIGSQLAGRVVAYARTGDMSQLNGATYYLGTAATIILGETLKTFSTLSPEMSYLIAGISLAITDSYLGNQIMSDNILTPRLVSAAA